MEELTPAEITNQVRGELLRVYGKRYTSLCLLEYARGWYYFSEPVAGQKVELKGNPLGKPMQRQEMLKLLENLRTMKSKKRKNW